MLAVEAMSSLTVPVDCPNTGYGICEGAVGTMCRRIWKDSDDCTDINTVLSTEIM